MAEASNTGKTVGIVALIVGGVIVVAIVVIGILAVLAIAGVRGYLTEAKSAEGRNEVKRLAEGIRACSGQMNGGLPESTQPVPAALAQVSGKKYMSAPGDWSDRAYKCAGFSISAPQYFRYQWQVVAPNSGKAIAEADLDGDGTPDVHFEVPVTCAGEQCTTGTIVQRQR